MNNTKPLADYVYSCVPLSNLEPEAREQYRQIAFVKQTVWVLWKHYPKTGQYQVCLVDVGNISHQVQTDFGYPTPSQAFLETLFLWKLSLCKME